jgi:hypothetical protein
MSAHNPGAKHRMVLPELLPIGVAVPGKFQEKFPVMTSMRNVKYSAVAPGCGDSICP